jgi:hypothetical protein
LKARFELLQHASDPKTPAISLRFLETLTPVERVLPEDMCTISEPRPGERLSKRKRSGIFKPWVYSLAQSGEFARALKQFLEERALDKIKYGV